MTMPQTLTNFLLLLLLISLQLTSAFRVQVSIPEVIIGPEGAWFNCSVKGLADDPKDNKQESLESIKWFKDETEFYVYSAVDGRSKFHNMLTAGGHGIVMDERERSKEGNIYLPMTNVNTTGCYKCKVTLTDGRSKEIEKRSTTVFLPSIVNNKQGSSFPSIEVSPKAPEDFNTYFASPIVIASLNEIVTVQCTSRPSNPAAKLGIKINGILDRSRSNGYGHYHHEKVYESIEGTTYQNILFKSTSVTSFRVTREHVDMRFIRVSCSAILELDAVRNNSHSHGFLHQEDSEEIRIRVVDEKKETIRTQKRDDREIKIFCSFFIVTGAALIMNQIYQSFWTNNQEKKLQKQQQAMLNNDTNSFNVSPSFAVRRFSRKESQVVTQVMSEPGVRVTCNLSVPVHSSSVGAKSGGGDDNNNNEGTRIRSSESRLL
jgi:hypothetical protein